MGEKNHPFQGIAKAAAGGDDFPEEAAIVREAVLRRLVSQGAEVCGNVVGGPPQGLGRCHGMADLRQRPDMAADAVDGNRLAEKSCRDHALPPFVKFLCG
jgi:hypothetical protein